MANQNLQRKGQTGASFTTDISAVGGAGSSLFSPQQVNILDEERRLIDKVFSIVDKDNSGFIEAKELEDMFKLFGVDTNHLNAAISRIMSNVDKDHDGNIAPSEFYKLLSQKFEKEDPKREMADVFHRMDEKQDGKLDILELHKVAVMLGETMSKDDVKDMIRTFKRLYAVAETQGGGGDDNSKAEPKKKPVPAKQAAAHNDDDIDNEANMLTMDEFYFVCQAEL
mmetsp:Transcript_93847/g.148249  ORF Transcript_93847/g.148249 Transcript_93847/m.148249 type:complete len:225 (+) Transcript_93847:56-730(+)|eukprot:CAMPEP_0169124554 /NCGR_PEP_ID=MMETSP1015-20121227/34386_1 /TAXON_ID=342587 /ORGANISM="Karlodinium micrum, Strain CCMP2283" /LENGTH=224 /DNA_ID=CAMNT_0009187977 /DNA_START=56 /DNA_END=730 /DNA_ORIENTATION=+